MINQAKQSIMRHRNLEPLQVTIGEAAQLLSYTYRQIQYMLERGELRSVGHGRGRRVIMQSIREWQERNST